MLYESMTFNAAVSSRTTPASAELLVNVFHCLLFGLAIAMLGHLGSYGRICLNSLCGLKAI